MVAVCEAVAVAPAEPEAAPEVVAVCVDAPEVVAVCVAVWVAVSVAA